MLRLQNVGRKQPWWWVGYAKQVALITFSKHCINTSPWRLLCYNKVLLDLISGRCLFIVRLEKSYRQLSLPLQLNVHVHEFHLVVTPAPHRPALSRTHWWPTASSLKPCSKTLTRACLKTKLRALHSPDMYKQINVQLSILVQTRWLQISRASVASLSRQTTFSHTVGDLCKSTALS